MADKLTGRIQALPPELFNQIRDEVLSCDHIDSTNGCVKYVLISSTEYRFPIALHISRYHREQLAAAYLSNTGFILSTTKIFVRFAAALDDAHFTATAGFRLFYLGQGVGIFDSAMPLRMVHQRAERLDLITSGDVTTAGSLVKTGEPFSGENPKECVYVLQNNGSRAEQCFEG